MAKQPRNAVSAASGGGEVGKSSSERGKQRALAIWRLRRGENQRLERGC